MALQLILARIVAGAAIRGSDEPATPPGVNVNIGMSASIETRGLEARLKKLERRFPEKIDNALHKMAIKGADVISDRAARGVGAKANFKRYSTSYAEAKSKGWPRSGPSAKNYRPAFSGDPSGTVNLNVTGRMWAALNTRKERSQSVIFFKTAEAAKKAYFNNETREFMAFSNTTRKKLMRLFEREVFRP